MTTKPWGIDSLLWLFDLDQYKSNLIGSLIEGLRLYKPKTWNQQGKKNQLKPEACSVDEFHSHCTPAKTLGDMLVLEKLIDMRMMLSPAGLRSMCSRQVISTVVIYTPCFAEHIIAFACIRIIQRKIRNIPS